MKEIFLDLSHLNEDQIKQLNEQTKEVMDSLKNINHLSSKDLLKKIKGLNDSIEMFVGITTVYQYYLEKSENELMRRGGGEIS